MALSSDERNTIELVFMRGPAALLERNWTLEQIYEFFDRLDVKAEMELLAQEFKHQEAYHSRIKFGIKRQLARLAPGATAILGAALAGPLYSRDSEGRIQMDVKGQPILAEAGPTVSQVRAATEILDRIGVGEERQGGLDRGVAPDVNVNVILHRDEKMRYKVETDPNYTTEEERALSRERMRNVIEIVRQDLPEAREKATRALLGAPKKKAKKKRTGVKKKTKVTSA
ncbi:hypothetical protein LCGC14_1933270 [marine sediment metagenome]|uniref:Uncharacterized protein n=1 Tax=marine sediment metagenome TaxID=412755 RepID=A0A0F9GAR0_9ZZZZ